MLRRYLATYQYTVIVMGEPREFVHETIIEAADLDAAKQRVTRHFDELSWSSGAGWKRVLNRWRIAEVPQDREVAGAVPCRR